MVNYFKKKKNETKKKNTKTIKETKKKIKQKNVGSSGTNKGWIIQTRLFVFIQKIMFKNVTRLKKGLEPNIVYVMQIVVILAAC